VCDKVRPQPGVAGERLASLDRAVDKVLGQCIDLDPTLDQHATRRASDGRSIWIEPVAAHVTSGAVLAQEEAILTWAIDAQTAEPTPSPTVRRAERLGPRVFSHHVSESSIEASAQCDNRKD
jgi:hypothetical protein